jgi:hypothetical protein
MKGDNSTWRQAVRPTGVAVDGGATVGGDDGDSVGGGGDEDDVNLGNK